jgi:hypothetical protein
MLAVVLVVTIAHFHKNFFDWTAFNDIDQHKFNGSTLAWKTIKSSKLLAYFFQYFNFYI